MAYDKVRYIPLTNRVRLQILRKIMDFFKIQDQIKLVLVFGSFVRRNLIRDIDVTIYAAPSLSFSELLQQGTKLEIFVGKPIDLVQLQDLSPHFRTKILREGQLLLPTRRDQLYHEVLAAAISQLQDLRIKTHRVQPVR